MFSARRVYVYLVLFISLASIALAAISLLQELLTPSPFGSGLDIALQIAILIIATPVYLGHWLWQQRKVTQDQEERGALERRIYLYAVIAGAVAVAAFNVFDLLEWALDTGTVERRLQSVAGWRVVSYYVIPVVIAAGAWLYHTQLLRCDQDDYPDSGARGSVHRIYLYVFSAAGLIMVGLAVIDLLRWLLSTLGDALFDAGTLDVDLMAVVPRISVGLALWLFYWLSAQNLFRTGGAEETASILRKFYLYAAIFAGVAGGVSSAALILSGVFQTWLGLAPEGDIRNSIALIIAFALLWFYHGQVLIDDARAAERTAQQAEIRRIYLYLLSGVGLVGLLVGIIGDISTLLFIVDDGISDVHREALSYFSAALIAGLPVWYLAWRKAQQEVTLMDRTGSQAHESTVRKVYLYFFLFLSITSVLGSAIYVLYRLLQWFLSGETLTLVDVAVPLTIAVIQLLVWVYHLNVLRTDRRLSAQDEVRQLADIQLALVDHANSALLQAVADRLRRAAPGMEVNVLKSAGAARLQAEGQPDAVAQIEQAEIVVVPSTLFTSEGDAEGSGLAAAVANSSAQKIVLPEKDSVWHWVGVEAQSVDDVGEETLEMLRRVVSGEEIRGRRQLGCGLTALVIVAGVILMGVLILLIPRLMYGF